MNRSAVAIPIAMMFVALSMMFTTLGSIDALNEFRIVCWIAGPTLAAVGAIIALRRLRAVKRELAEQDRALRERRSAK